MLFAGHLPDGRVIGPGELFPVATAGNALGSTFERFSMLEGRAAHQYEEREATASFLAADQLGIKVGDKVRIHFFAAKTFYQSAGASSHAQRAAQPVRPICGRLRPVR